MKYPPRLMHPASWILAFLISTLGTWYLYSRQTGDDFSSLWIAGELVKNGMSDHIYDHSDVDFSSISGEAWNSMRYTVEDFSSFPHPYVHIPIVAGFCGMLALVMTGRIALTILTFISFMCAFILVASSYLLWTRKTISTPFAIVGSLALIVSPPFVLSLWIGQTTPFILAGVVYGIAQARFRPVLAGITLGIVAAIKLTPLAVIAAMFLFRGSRKSSFIAGCTSIFMFLSSLVIMGWNLTVEWIERIQEISGQVLVADVNQSFVSLFMRDQMSGPIGVQIFSPEDVPAHLLSITHVVMVIAIVLVLISSYIDYERRFALITSGILVITMSFSSLAWSHYFIVAVVMIMGLITLKGRTTTPIAQVMAALAGIFFMSPLAGSVGTKSEDLLYNVDGGMLVATITLLLTTTILAIYQGLIDDKAKVARKQMPSIKQWLGIVKDEAVDAVRTGTFMAVTASQPVRNPHTAAHRKSNKKVALADLVQDGRSNKNIGHGYR